MIIRFLKKYALTEFLLLIISIILEFLLSVILGALNYTLAACNWELRKYMLERAYINDVEGNVKFQYTLNLWMVKPGGEQFGDPFQSLSYVIGRNIQKQKQKRLSKIIDKYILEPAEENHSLKAVDKYEAKILREANRILQERSNSTLTQSNLN